MSLHSFLKKTSFRECRTILSLAIPVFIAQTAQMGMQLCDTMMTGRYSSDELAAIGVAGAVWWPISLIGVGCMLALSGMSSQLVGAGRAKRSVHLLHQGLILAFLLSAPIIAVAYPLSCNMEIFGLSGRLAEVSGGYLKAMMPGMPAFLVFIAARSFLEGFSLTKPAMLAGIVCLALNIPCNYLLIYGGLGIPAYGAVGCGMATSFCTFVMAACLLLCVRLSKGFRELRPLRIPKDQDEEQKKEPWVDFPLLFQVVRIGFPNAMAIVCESSIYTVASMALVPLGTDQVAAHQITNNIANVLFSIPLSLGTVTTIRVGHHLGAGDRSRAGVSEASGFAMSLFMAGVSLLLLASLRYPIAGLYTSNAAVVALTADLALICALSQVVDSTQIVLSGILRGYNDTKTISVVAAIGYWGISFPLGWILARTDIVVSGAGARGFWAAFVAGLFFAGVCYALRLRKLHRMSMEEISQKLAK